ncbi:MULTISPECIES: hypothetical protein [unclassified Dysgonomonas]|uniref:hypothetical protein n=1 Tax=unclassified Dysgonomonas TaxID=2630389 RepID=UPI0013ED1E60|nr:MULTISPECIES: hypothetical protein [unclassified Dysgonomonas]
MNRIKLLITLFFCVSALAFSKSDKINDESNKFELPMIYVTNNTVQFIADDLDRYVGNRKNGVSFPVLKMVFSKQDEALFIHVVAIDNTWCNLFNKEDKMLGYFISGSRLILVSVHGDNVDLEDFFVVSEKMRNFSAGDPTLASKKPNPYWKYKYKGKETAIIDSGNMTILEKRN